MAHHSGLKAAKGSKLKVMGASLGKDDKKGFAGEGKKMHHAGKHHGGKKK